MPVVFSEASHEDASSINGRELHAITEAARMYGCRVYPLPPSGDAETPVESALAYVPVFDAPQAGVWVGYIPTPERYAALYRAALAHNICMVNTPEQYQSAMEFDRFYPLLGDLTPTSRVVTEPRQLAAAAEALGFPLFVKGAVKSNKEQGWRACVAEDMAQLSTIAEGLFRQARRSRGRVILRRLARLRMIASDYQAFPLGREYRAFVHQGRVLACGFYWDEHADSARLTADEERAIHALACEAARRVGTPFIAVDIGQQEDGRWIVIEVGDGQFSGLSHVPVLELWGQLHDIAAPT